VGEILNRQLWRRLLVICGLSAVAVTAPLLDLYGRNPEVFVANRTSAGEMVLFGLIVALAVPFLSFLVLAAAELIGGRSPDIAYAVIVGFLSLAMGFVVSRQVVTESDVWALLLALLVGVVVWYMVQRIETIFVWASVALPLVLVMFFATSTSSRLIWESPDVVSADSAVGNPSSIVFLQLDELPLASLMDEAGEINQALFPNFARLATEGTWYRNAFSDSIATTQSVPAILTGNQGEKGMSPSSVDHPDNLFTLLGDTYDMHVIEWVADLCPEDTCPDYAGRAPAQFTSLIKDLGVVYGHLTLPLSAREELPSIDNAWKGFLGQAKTPTGTAVAIEGLPVPGSDERVRWSNWVQRLTNGIDANMGPTLSYAHLDAPHVPWVTNPSGTHYDRPEDYTEVEGVQGDGHWGVDSKPARLGYQRHLYQLGFLDTMLGRLFDQLDRSGQWDETMVVVVADHGTSFVPGEHRRWPKEDNRDDLYRVPLLVKYPGQTSGETVDAPAFGIDIVPTIVDVLEVETDWSFDGMSLLELDGTDRPHVPIRWCCNGEGVSTELSVLFDQVERNRRWIPDQSSWASVAASGPYASLLGESVDVLGVVEDDGLVWSLDRGAELAEADLESGLVQTLLTGRIQLPPGTTGDDLLVAVNGRVAGFGFVSRDSSGGGALRALLAEELILDGHNQIDILVPAPGGVGWLSGDTDVLTLQFFTEEGRELDVRAEGGRRIQVDKVEPSDGGWELSGWAADVTRKLTPDMIYLFAGEELIASTTPNAENKNVVRWFDSEDLLESGFRFDVDNASIPADVNQLTIIAEFDGVAVSDQLSLTR
jgi:hypothetical protein